jgi:hypothetical protein
VISFKEFLTEKKIEPWSVEKISVDEAIAMLNKYCKSGLKAIETGTLLYRGSKGLGGQSFKVLDSTNSVRTSRDTSNMYQLMMDTSESMSKIPSRSNSFICSTSRNTAENYGHTAVVFPFDGSPIAVSSIPDFIEAKIDDRDITDRISKELRRTADEVGGCLKYNLGIKPGAGVYQWTDASMINSKLKAIGKDKIKKEWNSYFFNGKPSPKFDALLNSANVNKIFTAICTHMITPASINVSVAHMGDKLKDNVECWFSGKAIAIPPKVFAQILVKLKNANKSSVHPSLMKVFKDEIRFAVTEAVNDKIFWSDFHKEKEITAKDGKKYKLVATHGWIKINAKPAHKSDQFRIVAKTEKGVEIGWVNFEKKDDKLEALDLSIQPASREKGIATAMYTFARELGNDIAPSRLQTGMGKQFWSKVDHSTGERKKTPEEIKRENNARERDDSDFL